MILAATLLTSVTPAPTVVDAFAAALPFAAVFGTIFIVFTIAAHREHERHEAILVEQAQTLRDSYGIKVSVDQLAALFDGGDLVVQYRGEPTLVQTRRTAEGGLALLSVDDRTLLPAAARVGAA